MKFISWNVNGLRACLKKGFEDVFNTLDADFFCIQETKMQPGQADFAPEGYTEYIYSADKKGYSGTAIWAREPALSVRYGLDEDIHNHEGRAITLEYPDFYLVNLYVPNSQNELARIDYRMQWEDDLRRYLQKLDAEKPVILCGDLNVAHEDIDLICKAGVDSLKIEGRAKTFYYVASVTVAYRKALDVKDGYCEPRIKYNGTKFIRKEKATPDEKDSYIERQLYYGSD